MTILKVRSKVTIPIFDTNINAVVVDHGQALITQNGFLAMILGEESMLDANLVDSWRRLMFFSPDTRVRLPGVVFEDEDGEEGIGYNIGDVILAVYEFSEDARQQSGPVVESGKRARNIVAHFATLGLYVSVEQLSGSRVMMI